MEKLKGFLSQCHRKVTLMLMLCLTFSPFQSVFAVLPKAVEKNSNAAVDGDFLSAATGYVDSGADLIAWGLAILVFIVVGVTIIWKFVDAVNGKAKWPEVGLVGGVGSVIMLFVVFAAHEATKVI